MGHDDRVTSALPLAAEPVAEGYLAVLTACIDPSAGHYPLRRADPEVRRRDYEFALRWWLDHRDRRLNRILLIENSGADLSSLQRIAEQENPLHKEVEFVSLDCNGYPATGHYGYAELKMLDLGLGQSSLRLQTRHMIKVSGRLLFPDLSRLLDRVPQDFKVVVDLRDWRGLKSNVDPFCRTQIFMASHEFYDRELRESWKELEAGLTHMEAVFYRHLRPLLGEPGVLLRFPVNCDPSGHPAHRTKSYDTLSQNLSNHVRGWMRYLAPGWWL